MIEKILVIKSLYSMIDEYHIIHKIETDDESICLDKIIVKPSPLLANNPLFGAMRDMHQRLETNGFKGNFITPDTWVWQRTIKNSRDILKLPEIADATP